jgi:hypothetical protein
MPEYIRNLPVVEAVQWKAEGDHIAVTDYGKSLCKRCNKAMQRHGLLAGAIVCPGDFIVSKEGEKDKFRVCSAAEFHEKFKPRAAQEVA